MSEEKKEILQMLKDGIISVDDAERLLNALNSGQQKSEYDHENKQSPSPFTTLKETLANIGPAISEGLATIGPVISGAVTEAVSSFNYDNEERFIEEGYEKIVVENNSFEIADRSKLLIVNKKQQNTHTSHNVSVEGVKGNACIINSEQSLFEVYQKKDQYAIKCIEGDLLIQIPLTVKELKTKITGGNISVSDVLCETHVNTMGGNITVKNIAQEFSAKTMGGDLELYNILNSFIAKTMGGDITMTFDQSWQGDGKATTMGGNVVVECPLSFSSEVKAATMGGDIKADADLAVIKNKRSFAAHKAEFKIGSSNTSSSIKLKTMGGDIIVRKQNNE